MRSVAYPFAATLGAVVACGAAFPLVQSLGADGFGVWTFATIGGVLGAVVACHGKKGPLNPVVPVASAAFAGLVGAIVFAVSLTSAPVIVATGALLGSSISLPTAFVWGRTRKWRCESPQNERGQENMSPRGYPRQYLLIGALGAMLGPVLGACAFAVYYIGVGVHMLDMSYYFWAHVAVGTIAGLLLALPYFLAWLLQDPGEPRHCSKTHGDR